MRTYLKQASYKLGLDIKRLCYQENSQYRLKTAIAKTDIDLVFDIGANVGQFAEILRELGYQGKILSVEPLSSAHKLLTAKALIDPEWIVHPRAAVSSSSASAFINVSGNSVSSSLLPMRDEHLASALDSQYIATEQVDVVTLESLYEYYATQNSIGKSCLLKIDAQGNEFEILRGFNHLLEYLSMIYLELSVEKMYEGEKNMTTLIDWLRERNFLLWSLSPSFVDKEAGRVYQYDVLFVHLRHCQ